MKKILCVVICMLMCVTAFTVTGTKNSDVSPNVIADVQNLMPNRDPWDSLYIYDIGATGETGANGNSGAEFDGTYLYSTRWAGNLIDRYYLNGTLAETFSIAGVSGLRDLAYDGTQYMYGGAAGGVIWKMDFTTKTLIQTLTGSFQSRAIAYDYDEDVLYCSNWGDPVWKVDPSNGAILGTFNVVSITSKYGFAYDPDPSGPYLWIFDQGIGSGIYQWDLTAGAFTGFSYDVGQDVGSGVGIAGGLWASPDFADGLFCIGGCVQDSTAPGVTDYLFGYELYSTGPANEPPVTPAAPAGPTSGSVGVSYSFTASTTDPEGDNVSYMFDWGNGNNSGWLGPFASGATATGSYAWGAAGSYDITVKAKDANDAESGVSAAHTIVISAAPTIEVGAITGGLFKVKAVIKNNGAVAATNVSWNIDLAGGIILLGKASTGKIPTIAAGGTATISSKMIVGFGKTVITVTADTASKTQNATVLLIFIKTA